MKLFHVFFANFKYTTWAVLVHVKQELQRGDYVRFVTHNIGVSVSLAPVDKITLDNSRFAGRFVNYGLPLVVEFLTILPHVQDGFDGEKRLYQRLLDVRERSDFVCLEIGEFCKKVAFGCGQIDQKPDVLHNHVVVIKSETLKNDERILFQSVVGEPCFVDDTRGLDRIYVLIEEQSVPIFVEFEVRILISGCTDGFGGRFLNLDFYKLRTFAGTVDGAIDHLVWTRDCSCRVNYFGVVSDIVRQ